VRAELTEEIKQTARRHLAADGANLSLRAVARDLGMVSSAVYRYFPSRDDLLTALIIDAYNALGEAVERAAAAGEREDLLGRWLTVGHAVRTWALERPHEYALIYGSPVPGYAAPADTVGPASRPLVVMAGILVDGVASGALPRTGGPLPPAMRREAARLRATVGNGVPGDLIARGLIAWTALFGAVTFEIFGRLEGMVENTKAWFDYQLREMARFTLGLS
jgi:AcrR family transcriptional regulator